MMRHYVFLKYRETRMRGTLPLSASACSALRDAIDGIQHLEIGRDELRDARSWDLVLIMEFASVDALRAYQRHPRHLAVMAFNEPFVADVASSTSRGQSTELDGYLRGPPSTGFK